MTTDMDVKGKRLYNLNCITHALALLNQLFDAEEGMTLMELCLAAEVSKNKAFRLMNNFEHSGVVAKDGHGRYCLGASSYVTARKIVSRGVSAEKIRSVLEKLAEQFGEAVYFAKRSAGPATLIDVAEGNRNVRARSFIGTVLPDGGAERGPGGGVRSVDGVTVSSGVMDPEITTVSIDIANCAGMVAGSLVVLAPSFRMSPERIGSEIIPVLRETVRLMPELAAGSERNRAASPVLQLVPKRDEVGSKGDGGRESYCRVR